MTERRKPADALTIYLILMRSLTKLLAGHVSGTEDGACWGIWTKCVKNNAPHLISSHLISTFKVSLFLFPSCSWSIYHLSQHWLISSPLLLHMVEIQSTKMPHTVPTIKFLHENT